MRAALDITKGNPVEYCRKGEDRYDGSGAGPTKYEFCIHYFL